MKSTSEQKQPPGTSEDFGSTERHTNVYITNNSGGRANITLSHKYTGESPQVRTFNNVARGATVGPLPVTYWTGLGAVGVDSWWVGIDVLEWPNKGHYESDGSKSDPDKTCVLRESDQHKSLYFSVDTKTFFLGIPSGTGPCTTDMS